MANSKSAIKRAVKYGQAWHPTRLTPDDIKNKLPYIKALLSEFGKNTESFLISLKRNLNFTDLNEFVRSKPSNLEAFMLIEGKKLL